MVPAENGVRNAVMIFRPGEDPLIYAKRALWGWDRDNFVPGDAPGVFSFRGWKIGGRAEASVLLRSVGRNRPLYLHRFARRLDHEGLDERRKYNDYLLFRWYKTGHLQNRESRL